MTRSVVQRQRQLSATAELLIPGVMQDNKRECFLSEYTVHIQAPEWRTAGRYNSSRPIAVCIKNSVAHATIPNKLL